MDDFELWSAELSAGFGRPDLLETGLCAHPLDRVAPEHTGGYFCDACDTCYNADWTRR